MLTLVHNCWRMPYGTKAFSKVRQGAFAKIVADGPDGEIFRRHASRIYSELGLDGDSPEDALAAIKHLAELHGSPDDEADTGDTIKMSKWFGWFAITDPFLARWASEAAGLDAYVSALHQTSAESLQEAEEAMRSAVDDLRSCTSTREVMAKLKSQRENSLRVAYRIVLHEGVHADAKIIVNVCRPLWTAHTKRVKNKLTPADNLAHCVRRRHDWVILAISIWENATSDPVALGNMNILFLCTDEERGVLECVFGRASLSHAQASGVRATRR